MYMSENQISQDVINLVIARLETIPANVSVSIGGDGSYTIEQLIERLKKQDKVSKKMVAMQLAYIRSLGKVATAV